MKTYLFNFVKSNSIKDRKVFFIVFTVLYLCLSVFVSNQISFDFVNNRVFSNIDESLKTECFASDASIAVRIETDYLTQIHLPLKNIINGSNVNVKSNSVICVSNVEYHDDVSFLKITFNPALKGKKGQNIEFEIFCENDFGIAYNREGVIQNKQYGMSNVLRIGLFSALIVCFVVAYLFLCFLLSKNIKTENLYLILAFVFGIINLFVTAPFSQPDAATHFESIYYMSDRMIGIKPSEGMNAKRKCDLNLLPDYYDENMNLINHTWTGSPKGFFMHMADNFSFNPDMSLVEVPRYSTFLPPRIEYFPQALFITIARLLGFNQFGLYFMGLFGNYFFLVLLMYLAIRKARDNGCLFLLFALNPIILKDLQSYTYDGIVVAMTALACSFLYSILTEKSISNRDFVLSLLVALVQLPLKTVYFPVGCILIIVSVWKKFNIPLTKKMVRLFLLMALGAFVLVLLVPKLGIFEKYERLSKYSVIYFLRHPFICLNLIVKNLVNGSEWFSFSETLFLNRTGNLFDFAVFLLFFVPLFSSKETRLSKAGGLCFIIPYVFVSFFLFVVALSWSRIGSFDIWGLQQRYFYPVTICFYLFLQRYMQNKLDIDRNMQLFIIIPILLLSLLSFVRI